MDILTTVKPIDIIRVDRLAVVLRRRVKGDSTCSAVSGYGVARFKVTVVTAPGRHRVRRHHRRCDWFARTLGCVGLDA